MATNPIARADTKGHAVKTETQMHPTDADLDEAISIVADGVYNDDDRSSATHAALLILADRVRAMEAAMPRRGTWRDDSDWSCRCVAPDAADPSWMAGGIAVCDVCYTIRPLPIATAPAAERVGKWDEHGMWRCDSPCSWKHSASVTECRECPCVRPPAPAPAAPAVASGGDVGALAKRMREAAVYATGIGTGRWGLAAAVKAVACDSGNVATTPIQSYADHIAAASPANVIALCDDRDAWEDRAMHAEESHERAVAVFTKARASLAAVTADRDRLAAELGKRDERNNSLASETATWRRENERLATELAESKRAHADNESTWQNRKSNAEDDYKRRYDGMTAEIRSLVTERDELKRSDDDWQSRADSLQKDRDRLTAELAKLSETGTAAEILHLRERIGVLGERIIAWQAERALSIQTGTPISVETENVQLLARLDVMMNARELRAQRIRDLEAEVAVLRNQKPAAELPDAAAYSRMDGTVIPKP